MTTKKQKKKRVTEREAKAIALAGDVDTTLYTKAVLRHIHYYLVAMGKVDEAKRVQRAVGMSVQRHNTWIEDDGKTRTSRTVTTHKASNKPYLLSIPMYNVFSAGQQVLIVYDDVDQTITIKKYDGGKDG